MYDTKVAMHIACLSNTCCALVQFLMHNTLRQANAVVLGFQGTYAACATYCRHGRAELCDAAV